MENKHARVMVLVHDTSSECALKMDDVSLKTSNRYPVIEWTRNCIANDQREITKKYPKHLRFFCRAYSHCALEKNEVPNSSNSVQLTEWTKNCI